jgi:hypothetical protein
MICLSFQIIAKWGEIQTSDRKIECNPLGTLVGKLITPTGLEAIVLASIITISEHLHNANIYILELFIQPKAFTNATSCHQPMYFVFLYDFMNIFITHEYAKYRDPNPTH